MGSGKSGLYSGTRGSQAAPGTSDFMNKNDPFSRFISKRKDVDQNGYYDLVAHGTPGKILVEHNGVQISVDHRVAARLLKNDIQYKGGAVRLLSCSTGKVPSGFAQNLANKLNRPVKAPSDLLWARPDGSYFVAAGKTVGGSLVPDMSKPGKFKTYFPRRRKKR